MKYRKLVENAKKPNGFWGKMMIKAMNKGHSSLTSWGLEHMNIERTATVLDIGCGGGKTVDRLCSIVANGKVYGIDYSELSVKSSEKLNSKNILCNKAKILQASVSDMPFDDNTFDNITAVETYYFWPDKECIVTVDNINNTWQMRMIKFFQQIGFSNAVLLYNLKALHTVFTNFFDCPL